MSAARILLVEDDDSIRMVAQLALESLGGFKVLALASGDQALAQAAGFAPQLLLLDVTMPGMDGPQTLNALRTVPGLQHVPAVFLTARTQPREVMHYRSVGAQDVITKPFDPAHLCERIAAVLTNPPAQAPGASQRLALVVEDDATLRYLLGFVLEQNGWRMLSAENGEEARLAIEDGPLADAVLLDYMLPGGDGISLLQQLRTQPRWSHVPVMMLTGNGDDETVSRALAAGADDFVVKPFDLKELVSRLHSLARRADAPPAAL